MWGKDNREQGIFYRFREGAHAWRRIAGGVATMKSRIIASFGSFLLAGSPWWIPENWMLGLNTEVQFSAPVALVITVTTGALWLFFLAGSRYLQHRSIRSLEIKRELHEFAHRLRDEYMAAQQNPVPIHETTDRLCQKLHDYFRILTKRNDISVAIRIARKQGAEIVYETMGRAGLNHHRQGASQSLCQNVGVVNLMRRMNSCVLYYPDILKAAEQGEDVYWLTANDKNYPNDVRSLMVAPINGWDGVQDSLLGLFFVGCQVPNQFGEIYTDSMMFVGDSLASLYAEFASQAINMREIE